MDTNEQMALLAEAISTQGGKLDAMYACLTGILAAAKQHPEVADLVSQRLEHHYAGHLAQSQNEHFMRGFESARDLLNAASK